MTTNSYDPLDRLTGATTKNSAGTTTDSYSYAYDGAGNRTSQTAGGQTTNYSYDAGNKLTSSTGAGATTYSYDGNGNELGSGSGFAFAYNEKNQTTSITPPGGGAQAVSYRGAGQDEMTRRGGDQFGYNLLGIGLKVHSDGTTSYFTRDDEGTFVSERAPNGSRYNPLYDGLGSVVATTDGSGAVANTYKYDPYGKVVSQSETSAHPNPFRFAGALYSSSLGLYKMGARFYDPSIGRWTQQDPIDQPGDLRQADRYVYAGDDPVNFADPAGTSTVGDSCSGAVGPVGASGGIVEQSGRPSTASSQVGTSYGFGGGCSAMTYTGGSTQKTARAST